MIMTNQSFTHKGAKRLSQQEKKQIGMSISKCKWEGDKVRMENF